MFDLCLEKVFRKVGMVATFDQLRTGVPAPFKAFPAAWEPNAAPAGESLLANLLTAAFAFNPRRAKVRRPNQILEHSRAMAFVDRRANGKGLILEPKLAIM
jgi:hypothetical protein